MKFADVFGNCFECGHPVGTGGCVNYHCPMAYGNRRLEGTNPTFVPVPVGIDHRALLREAADALDMDTNRLDLIRRLREAGK